MNAFNSLLIFAWTPALLTLPPLGMLLYVGPAVVIIHLQIDFLPVMGTLQQRQSCACHWCTPSTQHPLHGSAWFTESEHQPGWGLHFLSEFFSARAVSTEGLPEPGTATGRGWSGKVLKEAKYLPLEFQGLWKLHVQLT